MSILKSLLAFLMKDNSHFHAKVVKSSFLKFWSSQRSVLLIVVMENYECPHGSCAFLSSTRHGLDVHLTISHRSLSITGSSFRGRTMTQRLSAFSNHFEGNKKRVTIISKQEHGLQPDSFTELSNPLSAMENIIWLCEENIYHNDAENSSVQGR